MRRHVRRLNLFVERQGYGTGTSGADARTRKQTRPLIPVAITRLFAMLKRPLNPRFREAVLAGVKTTTIRENPWPCDVPIMLYSWEGLAYRSPQINLAPIIVETVGPIEIHHRAEDGEMFYALNNPHAHRLLWETEGFWASYLLDEWFRPLVKPGQTVTKCLMRFHLANAKGMAPGSAVPTPEHENKLDR